MGGKWRKAVGEKDALEEGYDGAGKRGFARSVNEREARPCVCHGTSSGWRPSGRVANG